MRPIEERRVAEPRPNANSNAAAWRTCDRSNFQPTEPIVAVRCGAAQDLQLGRPGAARVAGPRLCCNESQTAFTIDPPTAVRLLISAGRIGSDDDKARVLIGALDIHLENDAVAKAFFESVARIRSDSDRSRVLQAVATRPNASIKTMLRVVESAEGIRSDSDKSRVMLEVARLAGADPTVSARIRRAAGSIGSGSSYRRVLSELGDQPEPAE